MDYYFALAAWIATLLAGCITFFGVSLTRKRSSKKLTVAAAVVLVFYVVAYFLAPTNIWLSNVLVFALAITAGGAVGSTLAGNSAIIAFCVTVAVVDALSFSGGLTALIISNYSSGADKLFQYLSISIPFGSGVQPIVGIGDLLILACLFFGLRRLGYGRFEALVFPLGGLLCALAVGLLVGGIYALPFVAGATVLLILGKNRNNLGKALKS